MSGRFPFRRDVDIVGLTPLYCEHSTRDVLELSTENFAGPEWHCRTLRQVPHVRRLGGKGLEFASRLPSGALFGFSKFVCVVGLCLTLCAAGCAEQTDDLGLEQLEIKGSVEEAAALAQAKDYEGATALLQAHVSMPTPETRVLTMYGSSLIANRRASLGMWALGRAAEREDAPRNVQLAFLRALISGGDPLAAIDRATGLLEAEPDDIAVLDLRAQAYDASMDYENALADLEIVGDENPETPILIERLLNLHIQIEDWDGARERIAELESLLARDGVDKDARTIFCATAATFEQQRGEIEAAEAKIRGCLEDYPAEANLAFTLTGILDADGRSEEATELLADLAERFPKRQAIVHGYGERLVSLGRREDAEALLLKSAETATDHAAWLAIANMRLAADDVDGTGEALDKAIEMLLGQPSSDPDLDWSRMLPESRFGIGDVYIRAGRLETANRIIDSLTDEPAMAGLLRARIKLERGDPQGALEDYQESFKTFPSNAVARYLAGRAAVEVGEFDLALEMFQDALRSEPTATDAGFVLAQMLAAEGRYGWAMDALSFRSARSPNGDPLALRMLARLAAAASSHKYAEGLRALLSESLAWVGFAMADQAHDVETVLGAQAAIDYLDGITELEDPGYHEAFSAWYRLAFEVDREDEARKRLAALLAAHPEDAGARIVEARALVGDDDLAGAVAAYQKSIELSDASNVPHYEIGQVLAKLGRTDEAVAEFDRAAEFEDIDGRAAYGAVRALHEAGRDEEAIERLRTILIDRPFHGASALLFVQIASEQADADPEEVYSMARRANRYHMHAGPSSHFEFGERALERDAFEDAWLAYGAAVSKNYDVANALYGRARALVGLGREAEAMTDLEAALNTEDLEAVAEATALLDELRADAQKG